MDSECELPKLKYESDRRSSNKQSFAGGRRSFRSLFYPLADRSSPSSPLMKYLWSADASVPPTAVKIEEDVIVMDAIPQGGGVRMMSSPVVLSDPGPGSFGGVRDRCRTGNSKLHKYALCHFWPAGMCRYGSNCQYAHGIEELHQALPSLESGMIKTEVLKSNITFEGSPVPSSQGTKHSPNSQLKAPQSSSAAQKEMAFPKSAIEFKQPCEGSISRSSRILYATLPRTEWSPQDDGIQVTLPSGEKNPSKEDVNKHIEEVLYWGKPAGKRLPVFKAICQGLIS